VIVIPGIKAATQSAPPSAKEQVDAGTAT